MLPIQEAALERVTTILDAPDLHLKGQEIQEHLDTIIEYARDDDERRAAVKFKIMTLNHIYSIGRKPPEVVEANRVDAFKALGHLQRAIDEGSAD